jgi:hypothetical protein
MTHEELLEELNEAIADFDLKYDNSNPYYKALRAVVELHKPYGEFIDGKPSFRCQANHEKYPCPTIQAIEKELK